VFTDCPTEDRGQHLIPRRLSRCVKEVEIRILRTKGSCSAGLADLKVIGSPVAHVDRKEIEKRLSAAALRERGSSPVPHRNNGIAVNEEKSSATPTQGTSSSGSGVEIVDALTCEKTKIPMVLPSGQIVDKSTLDEYAKREAVWGRQPNDPFTGKIFTKDRRPILLESTRKDS
jgi:U-box domain-containing protein 5